jgi:hypothetical protein
LQNTCGIPKITPSDSLSLSLTLSPLSGDKRHDKRFLRILFYRSFCKFDSQVLNIQDASFYIHVFRSSEPSLSDMFSLPLALRCHPRLQPRARSISWIRRTSRWVAPLQTWRAVLHLLLLLHLRSCTIAIDMCCSATAPNIRHYTELHCLTKE